MHDGTFLHTTRLTRVHCVGSYVDLACMPPTLQSLTCFDIIMRDYSVTAISAALPQLVHLKVMQVHRDVAALPLSLTSMNVLRVEPLFQDQRAHVFRSGQTFDNLRCIRGVGAAIIQLFASMSLPKLERIEAEHSVSFDLYGRGFLHAGHITTAGIIRIALSNGVSVTAVKCITPPGATMHPDEAQVSEELFASTWKREEELMSYTNVLH